MRMPMETRAPLLLGAALLAAAIALGCERGQPAAGAPPSTPATQTGANRHGAPPGMDLRNPGSKIKPEDAKVSGALGSRTNPVRCDFPAGERAYLERLRCKDGSPVKCQRIGSVGAGPYGNMMDGYLVFCGATRVEVIMDMYHPGYVESQPVPGFTFAK
jgi:hypothetical protein